jgi:phospholipase C
LGSRSFALGTWTEPRLARENPSFDHLLGWHPTANAMNAELSYADDAGVSHPTIDSAPDFQGCGFADSDHSWEGGRADYNNGAMHGFLKNRSPRATTQALSIPTECGP